MHPAYSVILFTTASGAGYGLLVWLALFGAARACADGALAGLRRLRARLRADHRRAAVIDGASGPAGAGVARVLAVAHVVAVARGRDGGGDLRAGGAAGDRLGVARDRRRLLRADGAADGRLRARHALHHRHDLRLAAHHPAVAPAAHGADLHRAGPRQRRRAAQSAAARCSASSAGRRPGSPSSPSSSPPRSSGSTGSRIDGEARTYTAEAATGLGHLGKVRPLEPPHTQPNFVMREMGYRVARKHAEQLRGLALLLAFAVPVAAPAAVAPAGRRRPAARCSPRCRWRPASSIERWLFFAEAEHVAMLYYGAEAA